LSLYCATGVDMMSGQGTPFADAGYAPHPGTTGSPFSFQLRASCCLQCGQAVSGPDGGRAQCTRCGQPVELKPRSTFARPTNIPPPAAQHPSLRAQDGKPLLPPPNIAFLWENGSQIPPHREAEALAAWQGARRRALAMDIGAGEEICMLTRALAQKVERAGDWTTARAMIEAGLECVPLPRHRAILLGLMARAAVRAGDTQSAAAWLACFEQPQDLESESEHRMTAAVVATARGDFNTVLNAVGTAFDEIAIQDALDLQAALFRINALENVGRASEAAHQLQALFAKGPSARNAVESIQGLYGRLSLCRMTMPAVMQAHEQQARSSAGVGKIGLGCLLLSVSFLPFVILSSVAVVEYFTEGTYEAFIGVPFSFIFVLAFGLWGVKMLRMGQRERRVFASGVRAPARVIGASPTGTRINGVPEMRIDLEVQLQPPVRTHIRTLVHAGQHQALVPGALLYVRVDPQNPDLAVLDQ
jgi:hypothetical protein